MDSKWRGKDRGNGIGRRVECTVETCPAAVSSYPPPSTTTFPIASTDREEEERLKTKGGSYRGKRF